MAVEAAVSFPTGSDASIATESGHTLHILNCHEALVSSLEVNYVDRLPQEVLQANAPPTSASQADLPFWGAITGGLDGKVRLWNFQSLRDAVVGGLRRTAASADGADDPMTGPGGSSDDAWSGLGLMTELSSGDYPHLGQKLHTEPPAPVLGLRLSASGQTLFCVLVRKTAALNGVRVSGRCFPQMIFRSLPLRPGAGLAALMLDSWLPVDTVQAVLTKVYDDCLRPLGVLTPLRTELTPVRAQPALLDEGLRSTRAFVDNLQRHLTALIDFGAGCAEPSMLQELLHSLFCYGRVANSLQRRYEATTIGTAARCTSLGLPLLALLWGYGGRAEKLGGIFGPFHLREVNGNQKASVAIAQAAPPEQFAVDKHVDMLGLTLPEFIKETLLDDRSSHRLSRDAWRSKYTSGFHIYASALMPFATTVKSVCSFWDEDLDILFAREPFEGVHASMSSASTQPAALLYGANLQPLHAHLLSALPTILSRVLHFGRGRTMPPRWNDPDALQAITLASEILKTVIDRHFSLVGTRLPTFFDASSSVSASGSDGGYMPLSTFNPSTCTARPEEILTAFATVPFTIMSTTNVSDVPPVWLWLACVIGPGISQLAFAIRSHSILQGFWGALLPVTAADSASSASLEALRTVTVSTKPVDARSDRNVSLAPVAHIDLDHLRGLTEEEGRVRHRLFVSGGGCSSGSCGGFQRVTVQAGSGATYRSLDVSAADLLHLRQAVRWTRHALQHRGRIPQCLAASLKAMVAAFCRTVPDSLLPETCPLCGRGIAASPLAATVTVRGGTSAGADAAAMPIHPFWLESTAWCDDYVLQRHPPSALLLSVRRELDAPRFASTGAGEPDLGFAQCTVGHRHARHPLTCQLTPML
jgi:hypothetical protein